MRHLALLALAAATACGAQQDPDPTSNDPGGVTAHPDAGPVIRPDAAPPAQTSPVIDGFALDVHAGDWWQFRYEETWNGNTTQSSVYRFILDGPARTASGLSVFKLRVEGTSQTPPWAYLGFGTHGIFGSEDGVKFEPIFDAWNGGWRGATGLWGHGNGGPVHVGPGTRDGRSVYVASQNGGADCEVIPGYGEVCSGDSAQSFDYSEYFAAGLGPVGSHFRGTGSGGTIYEDSTLVAYHVAGKDGWWSRYGSCTPASPCATGLECASGSHRCQARCRIDDDCQVGEACLTDGVNALCYPTCRPASSPAACPAPTTCSSTGDGINFCW